MKRLLLASTSTIHGSRYLEYILPEFKRFLGPNVGEIIFIPFARPGGISHDDYTSLAQKAFETIGIKVKGLHEYQDKIQALNDAQAVFTGGGNTFVLVNALYKLDVMETLQSVVNNGTPYMGTSAGSNIAGLTMHTTNDMPIVYPPSFDTCGWIPFNINPHYLDPIVGSKHKGETRETRINEFLTYNEIQVIGLREGNWIEVEGSKISLRGPHTSRHFVSGNKPAELNKNLEIQDLFAQSK